VIQHNLGIDDTRDWDVSDEVYDVEHTHCSWKHLMESAARRERNVRNLNRYLLKCCALHTAVLHELLLLPT
jgi:hypothetical protein